MGKNILRLIANIERIGIHLNNRVVLIRCDALVIEDAPDLFPNNPRVGQIRGFCNNITNEVFKLTLGCRPENYSITDSSSGDYVYGRATFQESSIKFDDKTFLTLYHAAPSKRLYTVEHLDIGSVAEDMVKKIREYSYSKISEKSHTSTM